MTKSDPCLLRAHYERDLLDAMLNEWRKADKHAGARYDTVQCPKCDRWYVVARPDRGDAA